jgi:hypothetical protein
MSDTQIIAEPEWLSRKDTDSGQWTVESCEPRRGIPQTSIVDRVMRVPTSQNDMERCVRAHEMMHAKVSPAGEWEQWQKRGIASIDAMVACEELRVNYLCQKAGFPMDEFLSDGGETADGERIAAQDKWDIAVRMAIATAGTASSKIYLNGIRRHNRLWGKVLLDISKRAIKEMDSAHRRGNLASTEKHTSGLAPYGFHYTERLAEWVDRLTGMEPPKEEEEKEEPKGSSSETSETKSEEGKNETGSHTNVNLGKPKDPKEEAERFKGITPDKMNGGIPYWGELVIEKLPMPKQTRGNIGKTRIASNVGRAPRRLHRIATDPERRIFDKTSRGIGGVVIIDGSGSMSFTHDQIRQIVEASPGATVAIYSDMQRSGDKTNMWIVADKGKMVDELPNVGGGNSVDFPAIEWAVKNRQRSRSPIVWITDGGVCGPNQGYSETLAMQCINFCKKNRIVVLPHVEEAVKQLKKLQMGQPASRQWSSMFRHTYKDKTGTPLLNDEVR